MRREISDRLKTARKKAGYTQTDMAELLAVDINRFRKWEQGVNMPAIEIFVSLADYYGVSLDAICGRVEEVGEISQEEKIILNNYRSAGDRGKLDIMTISTIASQSGN